MLNNFIRLFTNILTLLILLTPTFSLASTLAGELPEFLEVYSEIEDCSQQASLVHDTRYWRLTGRDLHSFQLKLTDHQFNNQENSFNDEQNDKHPIIIGIIDFYFIANNKGLFISKLENYSITNGKRSYSRVGSQLLNIIKEIAKKRKLPMIKLIAQTPFNSKQPENNDLVKFYNKQGFQLIKAGAMDSFFEGHIMIWHNPEMQTLD